MATSDPSTSTSAAKPVVVRVKRKPSQARVDAFWLEINERPAKRAMLDFRSLSLSESATENVNVEEACRKKVFVQHVETVQNLDAAEWILNSYLVDPAESKDISKMKAWSTRFKQDNKQEKLRLAARQNHEDQVRNARFEQIWKRRSKGKDAGEDTLREICHLYDVVQVDSDEERPNNNVGTKMSLEEGAILCNYLPLLREYLPSAADKIESDLLSAASPEAGYVYDLYTVETGVDSEMMEAASNYPLLRVEEDDDFYDGTDGSAYDSDDSNAENNPLYDYPEEEESSGDDERDPFYDDIEHCSDSEYASEEVDVEDADEDVGGG